MLGATYSVPAVSCMGSDMSRFNIAQIVVDMSKEKGNYCNGQAYVAFSRVTTLDKLHIINYNQEHIKVSCGVKDEMVRL